MKVEDIILKGLDTINLKVDNLNTAVASLQTETENHGKQIEKLNEKFDKLPDCRYESMKETTSKIIVDIEALKRNKNFDTSEIDAIDKKNRKAFGKTIKTIVAIILNAIAGFFAWKATR